MQQFAVSLMVTINSIQPISESELRDELAQQLDLDSGTIEVGEVIEL